MEAILCLEAAERPQWPRVYSLDRKARGKGHECDPVGESYEKGGPTTPGSQTHQSSDGQHGVTDAAVAKPRRVDNASSQKSRR